MVDDIELSVIVHECGVVTLCSVGLGVAVPLVIRHEPLPDVTGNIIPARCINGRIPVHIHIRPGRVLAAEDAHIVAALVIEIAIGQEEIVVSLVRTGYLHVFDIRPLTGHPVTACHMCAEVGIRLDGTAVRSCRILDVVVSQTGVFVQLQHIDPAEPRTIDHPEIPGFIIEHTRVDGVRAVLCIPSAGIVQVAGKVGVRTEDFLDIGVLVAVGGIRRLCLKTGIHNGIHIFVRSFKVVSGAEDNGRMPVLTVDGEIHAVLVHHRIPDDIRCPEIAGKVIPSGCIRPGVRLGKVGVDVLEKGRGLRSGVGIGSPCPVHKVVRPCSPQVRADDEIAAVLVLDDRRIVNGDTAPGGGNSADRQCGKQQSHGQQRYKYSSFLHTQNPFCFIIPFCPLYPEGSAPIITDYVKNVYVFFSPVCDSFGKAAFLHEK